MERPGSRAWLGPYDGEWRHGGAGCLPGTSPQSTPLQAQTRPCRQTSTRSREVSCEPPSPDLQPQGAQADQLPLGPRRVLRVRSRAGGGPGPAPFLPSLELTTTCRAVMPKSELSSAERVLARAGWELQVAASNSFWGRMWTPHPQSGCFFLGLASPRFGVQRAWGWDLPHTFLWELDPTC